MFLNPGRRVLARVAIFDWPVPGALGVAKSLCPRVNKKFKWIFKEVEQVLDAATQADVVETSDAAVQTSEKIKLASSEGWKF